MIVLLGVVLAAGLLLAASPWLWPTGWTPRAAVASTGRLRRLMDAAGYAHAPVGRVAAVALGCAIVAASVAWLVTALPTLALLAAVCGAFAPWGYLSSRARRIRKARRLLWPGVCDLLVSSVRSGVALPEAVATLATTAPAPLRPAFAGYAADLSASGHFDSAVLRLKAVLGDPVADRIVETLRMARQVGGTELTTVLRSLSTSVRAESTLRAEVEARQSWIRGAAVLGVVAPWVIVALLATRPEGAAAYASSAGVVLMLVGAAVSVVAYRLMMRLGRLPEPQRWFA
ncbi:type II secretion system F family protein [Microbacterium telephonicum]|uniref:Type II secretion system protein F (GspF) n=1 Tax=Microbacterium telephonicum TaxID=1714841 RepID=A0A498BZG7_9MICO|nr:type II secretion system F family protein [Microbacterium telephonicum]RLK49144.1 type II secretion system protein F (GspF) [Microbacterium telephonicum]